MDPDWDDTAPTARAHVVSEKLRTMEKKGPLGGYFWPVITAWLVAVPLYLFRDESSILHVTFRGACAVVLILSLVEISRNLYKDLRGQRVPTPDSGRSGPTEGGR